MSAAAKARGCTCGNPEFTGYKVRFHTYECVLQTGINLGHVLGWVAEETDRAQNRFPAFNSPHEAKAVIEEELDELWQHVKDNTGRSEEAMREAIQVAAMALRYVLDLGGEDA